MCSLKDTTRTTIKTSCTQHARHMYTTYTVGRAATGKINVVNRLGPNPVAVGKLFALIECLRSQSRTHITATPCNSIPMLPQPSRSAMRFAQIKPIKYIKDGVNKSSCSPPGIGKIPHTAFLITQGSSSIMIVLQYAPMRTRTITQRPSGRYGRLAHESPTSIRSKLSSQPQTIRQSVQAGGKHITFLSEETCT